MITIVNFEPDNFSPQAKRQLQQIGLYAEANWEGFESNQQAQQASVIIVRFKKYLGAEVLQQFKQLSVVVSATTGTDHIDVTWCNRNNITILCLKPYQDFLKTIPSTAEHCFGLLLSLLRNIPAAVNSVREGNWQRQLFWGYQLKGKKLGIVGMGRTGSFMAKYAEAFDMQVYYYDPYVTSENASYVKTASLAALVAASDIVSLHVHLSDDTFHMVNSSLQPYFSGGKYLINTSRGKIVDEAFIYQLLKQKQLAGVASDVIETELTNITESHLFKALRDGENVLLTPHIGGATYDALHSCEEFICGKLAAMINGEAFTNA
jgi:D-3-phosphoglycerate dehydrogenase / 2-oxoglutarate reductase